MTVTLTRPTTSARPPIEALEPYPEAREAMAGATDPAATESPTRAGAYPEGGAQASAHTTTTGGPCLACDAMAEAGVRPGTVAGIVARPDGLTERHYVPDPTVNDLFFEGYRSIGFYAA